MQRFRCFSGHDTQHLTCGVFTHVERIMMQRGQADLCGKWYVVESDDRELLRDGVPVLAQLIDDRQCQLVTFAIQCGGAGSMVSNELRIVLVASS